MLPPTVYRLGKGESQAEALRRAKLAIASAAASSHPNYWAGFRVAGQAVEPVIRSSNWTAILVATSLALAAFGWAQAHRQRRKKRRS